ncbi:MAG: 3-hydroxyacyl-CoA dehydrogenase NAD-binding domain-containing protein [Anaerolineales bacterium]
MSVTKIRKVAVAGAGTMGPGIAATFASHGYETTLTDIQADALERAKNTVNMVYATLVNESFLSREDADAGSGRLKFELDLDAALQNADLIVETVPEKLEIKQSFLREVEPKVSAEAILASNTSGIPLTKLGEVCEFPGRVIGMHWSNPPHIIPVIEVIRGAQTTDETVTTMHAVIQNIDMIPVDVLRDVPGFVENRILYAIMREALHLVEQGVAAPDAVDEIIKWGVGYKLAVIPPLQLLDVAGLDIYNSVAGYLNADLSTEQGVSAAITEKVAEGNLGIKTGRGLFEYQPGEIPALMQRRIRMLLDVKKALTEAESS